jgi:hypothetical protein
LHGARGGQHKGTVGWWVRQIAQAEHNSPRREASSPGGCALLTGRVRHGVEDPQPELFAKGRARRAFRAALRLTTGRRRFKTIFDPSDGEERKRRIRALKSVGVDGVEAGFAAKPRRLASALHGIGDVQYMTRGFVEAWVEHQRKREGRSAKRWQLAAIIVGILGISGVTLWPLIERAWTALFGAN